MLQTATPAGRAQCVGSLCRDIHEGTYYPAVSLFTLPQEAEGASVTCNFGAAAAGPACSTSRLQPDKPAACQMKGHAKQRLLKGWRQGNRGYLHLTT